MSVVSAGTIRVDDACRRNLADKDLIIIHSLSSRAEDSRPIAPIPKFSTIQLKLSSTIMRTVQVVYLNATKLSQPRRLLPLALSSPTINFIPLS